MNMFDRESGDMLPRPAPKPTTPPNADMFKPAVPELSILFEQQNEKQHYTDSSKQNKSPPKKTQTYAAWKKQMLPQVAFPPSERDNLQANEPPMNELYPMRAPMPAVQPMGHMPPPVTIAAYNYESMPFYMHNISPVTARPTTAPVNVCPATYTHPLYQQQRRSLDAISTHSNEMYRCNVNAPYVRNGNEVLTLCASTQTETLSPQTTCQQFATKDDMIKLLDIVQQIRNDQLRILIVCETLAAAQKQPQADTQPLPPSPPPPPPRTQTTDAGTQFEQKTAIVVEPSVSPSSDATTKLMETRQNAPAPAVARFHTPRLPPAAQSTAYQGHTPTGILRRSASASTTTQPSKPTDKTLAMNELAMKYLPDEQLHELMHDMQITAPRNPVMERVMIAAKQPTDMSNASYKYLKKYRLLPDEEVVSTKTMRFYEDDTTRHSQPNSPYEQRPVDSPIILRRAASEGVNVNENRNDVFNLEDLRNKPKFM